jgi:hypothetical protein
MSSELIPIPKFLHNELIGELFVVDYKVMRLISFDRKTNNLILHYPTKTNRLFKTQLLPISHKETKEEVLERYNHYEPIKERLIRFYGDVNVEETDIKGEIGYVVKMANGESPDLEGSNWIMIMWKAKIVDGVLHVWLTEDELLKDSYENLLRVEKINSFSIIELPIPKGMEFLDHRQPPSY